MFRVLLGVLRTIALVLMAAALLLALFVWRTWNRQWDEVPMPRMLRHGVRPNGLASIPPLMPYGDMSDDDIVAILSYLRTLPPVRRDERGNEWTLLGKVMKSIVPAAKPRLDVHPPRIAPPQQMPWEAFAQMTPEDVGALDQFLLTVPQAGAPAQDDPTIKPEPDAS